MKVLRTLVVLLVFSACGNNSVTPSPAPTSQPQPTSPASPPATISAPTTTVGPTATLSPTASASPTATAAAYDAAMVTALQPILDKWRANTDVPGAVLGFTLPDGHRAAVASGVTDELSHVATATTDRFRIGSITKTFVATAILQLRAEGRLRLEDRLSVYLASAPHADQVTIRQLLDHTSGMPDFGAVPAYRLAILGAPSHAWTAKETIALIADKPLEFRPGSRYAYSNTNYTLLGMVIESIAGDSLADVLRDRVYAPASLSDTYLEEEEPAPSIVEAGHYDLNGDGKPDSVAAIPYTALVTSGAAAGGISSTADDVMDFAGALFDGTLLDQQTLDEMLTITPPSTRYALGIERIASGGHEAWGHGGALPGFTALFARADDGSIAVALANVTAADVGKLVVRARDAVAGLE